MALGTNYKRFSIKQNIMIRMQMEISYQNPQMTVGEIVEVTKGFPGLTVEELKERYAAIMDYRKCSVSLNHYFKRKIKGDNKMEKISKKQEIIKNDIAQAMESYKEVNGDDSYFQFPAFLTGWLTCKSSKIQVAVKRISL